MTLERIMHNLREDQILESIMAGPIGLP